MCKNVCSTLYDYRSDSLIDSSPIPFCARCVAKKYHRYNRSTTTCTTRRISTLEIEAPIDNSVSTPPDPLYQLKLLRVGEIICISQASLTK